MLKPFYMLEGEIRVIKRVQGEEVAETHYEDENGDRAIVASLRRRQPQEENTMGRVQ